MPELQVAVVLVACGVVSALLLNVVTYDESKVRLSHSVQDESLQDPFDVTKPEDIVDGEPVDEARFWARVRTELLRRRTFHQNQMFRCDSGNYS